MSGYVCKSAPIRAHIVNRKLQGFEEFEIQVLKDTTTMEILELLDISAAVGIKVRSIHLNTDSSDMFLESIGGWLRDEFVRTCLYVAEALGSLYGEEVSIVTHTDLNGQNIKIHDRTAESIIKTLIDFEKMYKHVNISVENLVPVYINNSGVLVVSSSFNVGNLEVVKYLREYGIENVYTTVDIAHIKMANNFIRLLKGAGVDVEALSYEKVLEENAEFCNNIHLADCVNLGMKREDHGVRFVDDLEMLSIVDSLLKTVPDASIVLEVIEDDYAYAHNAVSM